MARRRARSTRRGVRAKTRARTADDARSIMPTESALRHLGETMLTTFPRLARVRLANSRWIRANNSFIINRPRPTRVRPRLATRAASFFEAGEKRLRRASGDFERSERRYLELDPSLERTTYGPVTSTLNGLIRVAAFGEFRSLRFNEVEQGLAYVCASGDGCEREHADGVVMDDEALPYEYLRVMTAASMGLCAIKGLDLCSPDARAVIFHVGLGAGAAPAFQKRKFPLVDVEVVEIDPIVIDVAKNHLGVRFNQGDDAMRVVEGDCADVLKARDRESVDIVFMDAFDGDGLIPEHLIRDEFLQSCSDALKTDGSLVLNMFNGTRGSEARESVRMFAERLERFVGPVCTYPVLDSPVNVVLSATKRGTARPTREEIVKHAKALGERAGFDWMPHKLVEGTFWAESRDGELMESVPGRPGVMGKFKGRNGTNMPREYEKVLLAGSD